MIVVGIRFKPAGKVYYFDPVGIDLDIQDGVIVETARGTEFGTVVIEPRDVEESEVVQPLNPSFGVLLPRICSRRRRIRNGKKGRSGFVLKKLRSTSCL